MRTCVDYSAPPLAQAREQGYVDGLLDVIQYTVEDPFCADQRMSTGIPCEFSTDGSQRRTVVGVDILDTCPRPLSAVASGTSGTDGLTVGDTITIEFSDDTDMPVL